MLQDFCFRARFNTVSSAALVSAYSAGDTAPVSFSLSSVNSSSFNTLSRAPFFDAEETAVEAEYECDVARLGVGACTIGAPAAPAGLRKRNAAAATKTSARPPRIHHL